VDVTIVSALKMEAVYYPKTLVSTYHELHAQLFLQLVVSVVYEMTFYFSKILVQHGILWKGTILFESGYTKFHICGSVASYSFILYRLLIMSCEHDLGISTLSHTWSMANLVLHLKPYLLCVGVMKTVVLVEGGA
jgi:hypothetical protein